MIDAACRPISPTHLFNFSIPCLQPLLNAKDALLALPGTVSNLAASVKPLTDLGSQLTQLPAAVQVGCSRQPQRRLETSVQQPSCPTIQDGMTWLWDVMG